MLAADLALLHDVSLQPLGTPDLLSVAVKGRLNDTEAEVVHAHVAREAARLGYVSDRFALCEAVDDLRRIPRWPTNPDLPLRRVSLQLAPGAELPSVPDLLAALADLYGRLDGGPGLDPTPVKLNGSTGWAHDIVLLRDASHGLFIATDWVDMPEQHPRGTLGVVLRSAGLADLFISCRRLLWRNEDARPESMQVESWFELCLTGTPDATRLDRAVKTVAAVFDRLGYRIV